MAKQQSGRQPVPLAGRRGISKHLKDSWSALLVHSPGGTGGADALLDVMLAAGWIGGARRDVTADLLAGRVQRPLGPWGLVVQLAGHPWLYLLGDAVRDEWGGELAARLGWRTACFTRDDVRDTRAVRAYEGDEMLIQFQSGNALSPSADQAVVPVGREGFAALGGTLVDPAWLRRFRTGAAAQDALAGELGIYLPVLVHNAPEGIAGIFGRDSAMLRNADYARIDLVVFGNAENLEPGPADRALAAAIQAGDAPAVRAALAAGADVRYMLESDRTPLEHALSLGQGGTYDWRYKRITREQQLEVVAALLEGGAMPDAGLEPAIHRVIHCGDGGDERTVVRQLRLLLDHGADPNALGSGPRSSGQRPLHVVAAHHGWLAVIKLLLSRGADPTLPNFRGLTPRELAEERLAPVGRPGPSAAVLPPGVASLMRAGHAGGEDETARLGETIAFLAAPECGEADLSGIDDLAEASWQTWSAAHEEALARRKAANPDLWRELHGDA